MPIRRIIPTALKDESRPTSCALLKFNHLFIDDVRSFRPEYDVRTFADLPGQEIHYLFWPKESTRDGRDGFELRNKLGVVTIVEMYKKVGRSFEKIGYTYRYTNFSHCYDVFFNNIEQEVSTLKLDNFNFRFDKSLVHPKRKVEPKEHLQVLQQIPRFEYPLDYVTCERFLETLDKSFYDSARRPISVSFANRSL